MDTRSSMNLFRGVLEWKLSKITKAIVALLLLCTSPSVAMVPHLYRRPSRVVAWPNAERFRARFSNSRCTDGFVDVSRYAYTRRNTNSPRHTRNMLPSPTSTTQLCNGRWPGVRQALNNTRYDAASSNTVENTDGDTNPQQRGAGVSGAADSGPGKNNRQSDWSVPHEGPGEEVVVSLAASASGDGTPRDQPTVPPFSPHLDVLYRDQHIAAICKPPLMHVHYPEFGSKDKEYVLQKARNELGERVYFPHRLDRGTSGCLLLGFNPEACKILHRALSDESSSKTYVTLVRGSGQAYIGKGWFTVDRPIKDEKKILRAASTRFLFVAGGEEPSPRCCLVLAQPSTGRFHQIRRHLNGLSHPVVGDSVHGESRFNRSIVKDHGAPAGRLLLHCLRISLPSLPRPELWHQQEDYHERDRSGDSAEQSREPEELSERQKQTSEVHGGAGNRTNGAVRHPTAAGVVELQTVSSESMSGDVELTSVEVGLPRDSGGTPSAASDGSLSVGRDGGEFVDGRREEDGEQPLLFPRMGSNNDGVRHFRCPPPDDFMKFLRGMPWWKEGLIDAAEKANER